METFCSVCGAKISGDDKVCPVCGELNLYHVEVLERAVEENVEKQKLEKRVLINSTIVQVIIGSIMFVVGMVLTLIAIERNAIAIINSVACALCAGICVVFSIIGICKKEPTGKLTMSCLIISILLALSQIIFMFI